MQTAHLVWAVCVFASPWGCRNVYCIFAASELLLLDDAETSLGGRALAVLVGGAVGGAAGGDGGSEVEGLELLMVDMSMLLVDEAEIEADAAGDGLDVLALATLFAGALVALLATGAGGGALLVLRLGVLLAAVLPLSAFSTAEGAAAFSTAVLASATTAAGGAVFD